MLDIAEFGNHRNRAERAHVYLCNQLWPIWTYMIEIEHFELV
jgi:hypothetical protein